MREKSNEERNKEIFEKRLQDLQSKYEGENDFDLITIVKLEDEYNCLTITNPEHTKRRREILDMRDRLKGRLRFKA